MVLVRLSDGEQREFPNAAAEYADGKLVVRAADGEVLGEWASTDLRGFATVPEPEPDTPPDSG